MSLRLRERTEAALAGGPVGVNLLPPELATAARQRRVAQASLAMVLVYLLVLGGLYWLKLGDVAAATADRDAAQTRVITLQQEVAALEEFAVLAQQLEARNAVLADAMEHEISWASVFNDLSLAFPPDSSLLTLTAAATPQLLEGQAAPGTPGQIDVGTPAAEVAYTGYSVDRLAPGIQAVLVDLLESRGYTNTSLQTASEIERGDTEVTSFTGSVDLTENVYTDRYEQGLPEEVAR